MIIERKSPISGKIHTKDIPVTVNQLTNWRNGMLIQDAMPNIPPEDREFIKTGITAEEWKKLFRDKD